MYKDLCECSDIIEIIDVAFDEICTSIFNDLRQNDEEYARLREEKEQLEVEYPNTPKIYDHSGALNLSADEQDAFIKYLDINDEIDDIIKRYAYYRGQKDCYAYLRKIGAIV